MIEQINKSISLLASRCKSPDTFNYSSQRRKVGNTDIFESTSFNPPPSKLCIKHEGDKIALLLPVLRGIHKRARIWPQASGGIIIALPCNRPCNLRHYELSLTPRAITLGRIRRAVGPVATARVRNTWSRMSLSRKPALEKIRSPYTQIVRSEIY